MRNGEAPGERKQRLRTPEPHAGHILHSSFSILHFSFLTSTQVLLLVGAACTIGWGVAFVVFVAAFPGPLNGHGDPAGGDFLNFYTAGRVVLEGHGADLFDMGTQRATQKGIVGREDYHALAAYVNPPTLALVFAPLAALPYRVAYVLYSLAALAVFLAGMQVLRPHLPAYHRHWRTVVLISLSFYPMIRTITGGQNTGVSLCLLAAVYAALRNGRPVRAGLALGVLFYKPQFALLMALLLLFRKQFRCVAAASFVALGHYVVGTAVCGPRWPMEMLHTLGAYSALEFQYNGATQASWVGFFEYALPGGWGGSVGAVCSVATLIGLLWLWRRADPRREEFALYWAATVSATVLVSPHTQYYDTGLVLLAALLTLEYSLRAGHVPGPGVCLGLALAYAAFPAYSIAKVLGGQPLILLPVLTLLWTVILWRKQIICPRGNCFVG